MSDYPMLISNKLHSFRNFDGQRYMIFRIFTPQKTSNYREYMEKIEEICKED